MPSSTPATAGEVHLWFDRVDAPADLGVQLALLADDEQARAGRFRFERDRTRFIARRAFLRRVLAGYLDLAPAQVRYRTSAMGKPELDPDSGISFSTSHADGLAVVAVARGRRVGVDLERVRPIANAVDLAARFYTRREYEHVRSTAAPIRSEAFLTLWTRKESYVKAIGSGMSLPFDTFEVLGPEFGQHVRLEDADGDEPFVLASLDGPPGYIGSVAASGTVVTLRQLTSIAIPA